MKKIAISLAATAMLFSAFAQETEQKPRVEPTQSASPTKGKERPRMPDVEDVFKSRNKVRKAYEFAMPVGKGGDK